MGEVYKKSKVVADRRSIWTTDAGAGCGRHAMDLVVASAMKLATPRKRTGYPTSETARSCCTGSSKHRAVPGDVVLDPILRQWHGAGPGGAV